LLVLPARAEQPAFDRRKVDEFILLDITGSMVGDIRDAMKRAGYADGERVVQEGALDVNNFKLFHKDDLEKALADPRVQAVVTKNRLFKSIDCIEALIDQRGARRIHFATFAADMTVLGTNGPFPWQTGNILGPFNI